MPDGLFQYGKRPGPVCWPELCCGLLGCGRRGRGRRGPYERVRIAPVGGPGEARSCSRAAGPRARAAGRGPARTRAALASARQCFRSSSSLGVALGAGGFAAPQAPFPLGFGTHVCGRAASIAWRRFEKARLDRAGESLSPESCPCWRSSRWPCRSRALASFTAIDRACGLFCAL